MFVTAGAEMWRDGPDWQGDCSCGSLSPLTSQLPSCYKYLSICQSKFNQNMNNYKIVLVQGGLHL